jgi:hypothetical protein
MSTETKFKTLRVMGTYKKYGFNLDEHKSRLKCALNDKTTSNR